MLPALFHDWFGDWAEEVGVWGNWAWIVFVILMMIMANLGYSVYHVAMNKHSNSNIMLTNVIYQQMAALSQSYVSVIAANVRSPLSSLYTRLIHPMSEVYTRAHSCEFRKGLEFGQHLDIGTKGP